MRTFAFALCTLFLFAFTAPHAARVDDGGFNALKSFTKLQNKSSKLMGKITSWNNLMKQNEALIPADIKPKYDDFNKLLGEFNGKMDLLGKNPASLTEEAFKGLSGDLGKIGKDFAGLQGLTKGLPFMGK